MYGMMEQAYIDDAKLINIGFTQEELRHLHMIQNNGIKFSMQSLQLCGYNYEQAKRLMYGYNICLGKVQTDSKEEMIRHLKKMFGSNYRISIQDLAVSNISAVPRVAVVGNITQEPYTIWNSNRYKGKDALYKVIDVTGQRITIETPRKPQLKYGQQKVIQGILEIKGVRANGNAVVIFDKKYCQLCNRFIIVASLRRPEFHHGMWEILCFEGTRVYVYATNMGIRENVRYSMGTQRVYSYGIFPTDIKPKLDVVAKQLYTKLGGVNLQLEGANAEFRVLTPQNKELDENQDVTF